MTSPAPYRPSPTRAAAGRAVLPREELYRALVVERFAAPAPPAPPPGPGPSRRTAVPGAEQTTAYVLRLRGYGWTSGQISATTGLTKQQVQQILRRAESEPATDDGGEDE